jgi:hypothetical protein
MNMIVDHFRAADCRDVVRYLALLWVCCRGMDPHHKREP